MHERAEQEQDRESRPRDARVIGHPSAHPLADGWSASALPASRAVVIGASAGGPSALGRLLAALHPALDAAVVVVNHVGAQGPDFLPNVLGRHSALLTTLARERCPVLAGVIHIAPSGYHLEIDRDRKFSLSVDPRVCYSRPSIDVLFASAAEAFGEALAGVVLTGASNDGAQGLKRIRELGGLAYVQAPSEAEIDIMPRAALQHAGADLCAPLEAIAAALNVFGGRP